MRIALATMSFAALTWSLLAFAAEAPSQTFIKEAVEGNLGEVQAGQLARTKGTSEEVREFGATLNSEHGEATRKAAEAAQAIGVTPPTELSGKHKMLYQRLSRLPAEKFDQHFVETMIEDHKQDIAKYEKQAQQANDAAAAYAKETLPHLKRHLQLARELQAKIRAKG